MGKKRVLRKKRRVLRKTKEFYEEKKGSYEKEKKSPTTDIGISTTEHYGERGWKIKIIFKRARGEHIFCSDHIHTHIQTHTHTYTHTFMHMYIDVHIYVYMCLCMYTCIHVSYRVATMRRMPYLHRSFPAKEPYNYWLFCCLTPYHDVRVCVWEC